MIETGLKFKIYKTYVDYTYVTEVVHYQVQVFETKVGLFRDKYVFLGTLAQTYHDDKMFVNIYKDTSPNQTLSFSTFDIAVRACKRFKEARTLIHPDHSRSLVTEMDEKELYL